jgi:hypothetical protein
MGYALLYECMLDSVLVVRDAHLAPGGRMLPSTASVLVAAVADAGLWHAKAGFWRDVYGLDLSRMVRHVYSEPYVEVLPPGALCSPPATLREFDLLHMARAEQDVLDAPVELVVAPGTPTLHGIALWFDIAFGGDTYDPARAAAARARSGGAHTAAGVAPAGGDSGGDDDLPPLEAAGSAPPPAKATPSVTAAPVPATGDHVVTFSTGPAVTPTHWQQTLLLLDKPLPLPDAPAGGPGVTVRGSLSMVRDTSNPREYRFHLVINEPPSARHRQSFHMR